MRKFILALSFFLSLNTVFAQNLELELLRTTEAPGFFAVRIFPNSELKPLKIQNVFVKNFEAKEATKFNSILPVIREFGSLIIEQSEVEKYKTPSYRLIYLGSKENETLNFNPESEIEALDAFEAFTDIHLKPVFMENITVKFGGNISEVFPTKIDYLREDPVFFVGKFEREQKTRMEIQAVTQEGEIIAITPLHLEKFEKHELAEALPEIWENLYQETQPKEKEYSLKWLSIFPFLLAAVGILLIFTAIKGVFSKKETKKEGDSIPEEFFHQPTKNIEEDLPFRVEKKTK